MNETNNYLFKYITLQNSILFKNQGVTVLPVSGLGIDALWGALPP
jgi:hypothetical protein